jgi:hypothetical protein
MRAGLTRIAVVGGWLLVIVMLALWLAEAVIRGHAGGVWIVAVGLGALVIVPLLASRLRSPVDRNRG